MLQTYARIENGTETEAIVIRAGQPLPEGDWRPVIVEGLDFDRSKVKEVRRDTRIDADKVVRVVVTEDIAPPTRADYGAAVEAHINAIAVSRGYSSAASMISYEGSSVPQYAAEAAALRAWRDNVWLAVAEIEGEVIAGKQTAPSVSDLIAALPPHPFG